MTEKKGQQKTKMVVTVWLSNGNKVEHAYTPSPKEASGMMDMVFGVLGRKEPYALSFNDPNIVYNPDNVSGIQFDFVTPQQIEEFKKQMNKRIGYHLKGEE